MTSDSANDRMRVLARLLAAEGLDTSTISRSIRARGISASPLTYAQEVLWLFDRAVPGCSAYNVAMAFRLRGELDRAALSAALTSLIERHEILRTVFHAAGDDVSAVALPPAPVAFVFEDVAERPAGERERAAVAALQHHADRPFDLSAAPAFRAVVVRLGDSDHMLMLVTHHIVTDARSNAILFADLAALYAAACEGASSPLQPLPLQFGDFAAWQRAEDGAIAERLEYWRERLAGVTPLALPSDRSGTNAQRFDGACVRRAIPADAAARVRALAARSNATLYMVLLAAWQTLLHRYTGQPDIVVGSAVDGRTRTETESMAGYFSQALPMRTSFAGDPTFAEVLARTAQTVTGAFEHQDVPLEALLIEQRRAGSHAGLFRSVLTMAESGPQEFAFGRAWAVPVAIDSSQTKFDLTLFPVERNGAIDCTLWFRTELFAAATAERMLGHFVRVVEAAAAQPDTRVASIDIMPAAEHAELAAWNATAEDRAVFVPLHEAFAGWARETPDAAAVACAGDQRTYARCEAAAEHLAGRLRARGAGRGTCVAVALDRCADAIVAILAVLKTGAAFVPLAAGAPAARLAQQLTQCAAGIVIADPHDAERLTRAGAETVLSFDHVSEAPEAASSAPPPPVRPDDIAYVLFTSGSTGAPKGVCVTHANAASYAAGIAKRLACVPGVPLRFAMASTISADLGYTAIFLSFITGGTLHIVPKDAVLDAEAFAALASRSPFDVLKITPSHLRALLDGAPAAGDVLPRRWLILGGEPLPWSLAAEIAQHPNAPRILNHYGPTETTVGACTFEITAAAAALRAAGAQSVPIGTPLANVTAHVLDANAQPVPVGVPGELSIGGAGVSAGYAQRADLTAERFGELPGIGRVYRTGDRVRRLASGDLEFLGRIDRQVKIRGFRVELGEIEAALQMLPEIAQAAVVARGAGTGPEIVAYLVAAHGTESTGIIGRVRARLETVLPEYMIPGAFTVLAALPLTANGKIDTAALPAPGDTAAAAAEPATPTERALARLWREALNCSSVDRDDDFFALGGHSLIAIRVLGKISRELHVRLPLRTLFDTPVLRDLARVVDERRSTGMPAPIAPAARVYRRTEGAS